MGCWKAVCPFKDQMKKAFPITGNRLMRDLVYTDDGVFRTENLNYDSTVMGGHASVWPTKKHLQHGDCCARYVRSVNLTYCTEYGSTPYDIDKNLTSPQPYPQARCIGFHAMTNQGSPYSRVVFGIIGLVRFSKYPHQPNSLR